MMGYIGMGFKDCGRINQPTNTSNSGIKMDKK